MDHAAGPSKQTGSASSRGKTQDESPQSSPTVSNAGGEIVFITADSTGSKEARQAIRRRAAQYSHKVGRKKPKSKQQKLQEREEEKAAARAEPPTPTDSPILELPVREAGSKSPTNGSSTGPESSTLAPSTPPTDPEDDVELVLRDEEQTLHLPKDYVTSMVLRRSISDRDSMTSSSYPVPGKAWYPQLLEYTWTWMEQSWRHMENTTPHERASTLHFVQYLSMTEPAYFFMNLLSVADTLSDSNAIEPWKVVWLSGQVVKSINSALNDPVRMHSPGVILAVGRIALEEIVTGNREVGEKYHRPAQARLIAMSGGLDAVGLPSMVYKHVCWADRVMTRITDLSMTDLDPRVRVDTRPSFGPQPEDRDLALLNKYRPARRKNTQL